MKTQERLEDLSNKIEKDVNLGLSGLKYTTSNKSEYVEKFVRPVQLEIFELLKLENQWMDFAKERLQSICIRYNYLMECYKIEGLNVTDYRPLPHRIF